MKRWDDEELERALLALDLEEPPANLRDSILASTVYHVPAAAALRPWEPWLYGGLCAALVWLLLFVGRGGASEFSAAESYAGELLAVAARPAVLFWIAVGGAATLWISQLNLTVLPGYQRATRR